MTRRVALQRRRELGSETDIGNDGHVKERLEKCKESARAILVEIASHLMLLVMHRI